MNMLQITIHIVFSRNKKRIFQQALTTKQVLRNITKNMYQVFLVNKTTKLCKLASECQIHESISTVIIIKSVIVI